MAKYWKGKHPEDVSIVIEFVETLRAKMEVVRDLVYEKEKEGKDKQKYYHDSMAEERTFAIGEYAFVFRPVCKANS